GIGLDLKARRKDGTEFPVEISLSYIETQRGPLAKCLITDITQRKEAEKALIIHAEELRRANEELSQFAQVAAHDLQTPLRNIKTSAEFMAKRYQGQLDQAADQFIQYIVGGIDQMQELIEALLTYARGGEESVRKDSVQVSTVIETVLANLNSEIEKTGAEVTCKALPVVEGDVVQLSQLFQNLIGNAMKYRSKEPPRITISAQKKDQKWIFSVRDNAVGIAFEHRERIFAPLKRLHGPEIPGSGIGLAICKKIVERSGGRIWVESQVGQGSTFYFTLPFATKA
ncbi:MAG: ATP-binding protein, partial [Bryobacteraceae bacterium]